MPTNVTVNDLKINKLTEAQYDAAVQSGVIGENEISILTDVEAGQVIQVDTMPTASTTEEGKIYQYIGATDANYTNGYFYKCVSDGQLPATYSWENIEVQPAGDSLPDQTGNAGKFLTTDGTDASWSDKVTNPIYFQGHNRPGCSLYIGDSSGVYGQQVKLFNQEGNGLMIENSYFAGTVKIEFGNTLSMYALNASNGVNLGNSLYKWTKLYTTKVNNGADINVPNTAGTMVVTNYTGATQGQVLTLDSNNNAVWATPVDPLPSQTGNAGKVLMTNGTTASWTDLVSMPATMPQLTVAGWSSNTQTVNVTGVTANNVVFVSPAPLSTTEYAQCGVACIAQAAGTLTFTCTTVPENALTVNVVCL